MSDVTPATFSLLDALTGRSYPTDEVEIYLDIAELYKAKTFNEMANAEPDPTKSNEYHEQYLEHLAKAKETALLFKLQAYPPEVKDNNVREVRAKFGLNDHEEIEPGTDAFEWIYAKHIAEAVQSVVKADGSVADHKMTPETVIALSKQLPADEYQRLFTKVVVLTLSGYEYDDMLNADFS